MYVEATGGRPCEHVQQGYIASYTCMCVCVCACARVWVCGGGSEASRSADDHLGKIFVAFEKVEAAIAAQVGSYGIHNRYYYHLCVCVCVCVCVCASCLIQQQGDTRNIHTGTIPSTKDARHNTYTTTYARQRTAQHTQHNTQHPRRTPQHIQRTAHKA